MSFYFELIRLSAADFYRKNKSTILVHFCRHRAVSRTDLGECILIHSCFAQPVLFQIKFKFINLKREGKT